MLNVPILTAILASTGLDALPAPPTDTLRIASKVLSETRRVDIALPAGYASNPDRKYPILVVTDGESLFEVTTALTRFYAAVGQVPEMIVVGIPNVDRSRDLSPAPVAGFTPPPGLGETFGGAERFLTFLTDELLPKLDRDYRTVPMRTLVGHSIGGTFALYALAKRPEVFTGYVIMEPAAWWNEGREVDDAKAALKRRSAHRARVMMVNGQTLDADTTRWGGDAPMVRYFSIDDETHVSMPAAGLMQGLRAMFLDFRPTKWRPGTRPIAMLERFDSLAERVGYQPTIPAASFSLVVRMSLDGRFFDDAGRALERMERTLGKSRETQGFRRRLDAERGTPAPKSFIPLEFPRHRPQAAEAKVFLGSWESIDRVEGGEHRLEIRASGDTVVVHSWARFPGSGAPDIEDWPVIQLKDGVLEIGSTWLVGVPALMVFRCRIESDGTMTVMRENRGFARPADSPGPDYSKPLRYRKRKE